MLYVNDLGWPDRVFRPVRVTFYTPHEYKEFLSLTDMEKLCGLSGSGGVVPGLPDSLQG